MRRLFKHIIYFIFPVLFILYCIPLNNRLKYSGLENDCANQGAWIYNRTYTNSKPIDIAFLGSSHTLNGINDSYISKQLAPLTATNLGYCRPGRNLHYTLLKMILEEKKPKHVVLEIMEQEDRYSHPIFPLVSETKDVLAPTFLFNRDYFSDVWVHTLYKIELIQDVFYHNPIPESNANTFAFGPIPDTVAVTELQAVKAKRKKKQMALSDTEQAFYDRFPMSYIDHIKDLCTKHNMTLSFLYIPGYGVPYNPTALQETYSPYGHVLLPPQDLFNNTNYWADKGHLNTAGGEALSIWIADRLKSVIDE